MHDNGTPILRMEAIDKIFTNASGVETYAVKNAAITVRSGETLAVVGESGSGKSTLARIALGLVRPSSGRVFLNGVDIASMSAQEFKTARTVMQPVFQDATAALNPRRRVLGLLEQASRTHEGDLRAYAVSLLDGVGLKPGADYLMRYPHEMSGGQRQRFTIARALAMQPQLIVADEALSGADVSIRGQILNLFLDIREEKGVGCLFITHDISVAKAFADRVVVMKKGEIVEEGPAEEVLSQPRHEYTRLLLSAVPEF